MTKKNKHGKIIISVFFLIAAVLLENVCVYAKSLKTIVPVSDGFEQILHFSENARAIQFSVEGKIGLLNFNGEVITEPKYTDSQPFREGYAGMKKDGFWGYVDEKGNDVIPFMYEYSLPFFDGIAIVLSGGLYGALDKYGNNRIPFLYENISVGGEGLYAAQKDGKWGYVSRAGTEVIAFAYQEAKDFHEGFAAVKVNNLWGFINKSAKMIIPAVFESIGDMKNGYATVKIGDKYGIIYKNGIFAVSCEYDYLSLDKDGLVLAVKDGKYGYISVQGDILIDFLYNNASHFINGIAAVQKSGEWGVIDRNSKIIIPMIYDEINLNENYDKYLIARLNGKYGVFDLFGNVVISCRFDDILLARGEYAALCDNGKYGFSRLVDFGGNLRYVKKDGVSVMLDSAYIAFDQPPVLENGRVLAPVRHICELFGAVMDFDDRNNIVTAVKGEINIRFTIGSDIAYINGNRVQMAVPAKIVGGRTFAPVQLLAETFNFSAEWDAENQTLILSANMPTLKAVKN